MRRPRTLPLRGHSLPAVLLLVLILLACLPAPARADGPTITSFYTTTAEAHAAWSSDPNASPPDRTTSFPAGTSAVCFYYEFAGANPGVTQEQAFLYDQQGAVVFRGQLNTWAYDSGSAMKCVPDQPAYPDGGYRFVLAIDGAEAASAGFTVGPVGPIVAFYPVTAAAYGAWSRNSAAPLRRATAFSASTTKVDFVILFVAATTSVLQTQLVLSSSGVLVFKTPIQQVKLGDDGYGIEYQSDDPIPSGAYQVQVFLDGARVASTTFTVQPTEPISAFYTIADADYAAWSRDHSVVPRRTAVFHDITFKVAVFVKLRGPAASALHLKVVVWFDTGPNSVAIGFSPTSLGTVGRGARAWAGTVDIPPIPGDGYKLELQIGGATVASTIFMLDKQAGS